MKNARQSRSWYPLVQWLCGLACAMFLGAGCMAAAPQPQYAMPSASAGQGQITGSATESSAGQPAASGLAFQRLNHNLAALAAQSQAAPSDYRLGPEDLLQITLFDVPEGETGVTPRTQQVRVSQGGQITLPLIGQVQVANSTTGHLEEVLEQRYKKYLRAPQPGVFVLEYHSQRISVIGAVHHPGVFELSGPKTLVDLLALAGGLNDEAGRQVHLYRQEPDGRKNYMINLDTMMEQLGKDRTNVGNEARNNTGHNAENEASINPPVQNGDVINVPEADMFFVDGAIRNSGSFHLTRSYTLTQALSTAGGVDVELANTGEIMILRRRTPTEVDTLPIDLDAIQAGQASDPQIVAGDVIIVPVSGAKYFVKRFIGTIVSGVSIGSVIY